MTVACQYCNKEWPRDPALEVKCPQCNAAIGKKCKRPSEHTVWGGQPHAARDKLAMTKGFLEKCPMAPTSNPSSETINIHQLSLFN